MAAPNRNVVAEALRQAKRSAIDAGMGKGESWTSKVLNGDAGVLLDDIPSLLALLNLRVVPADHVHVDPEIARAYATIARKALATHDLLIESDGVEIAGEAT